MAGGWDKGGNGWAGSLGAVAPLVERVAWWSFCTMLAAPAPIAPAASRRSAETRAILAHLPPGKIAHRRRAAPRTHARTGRMAGVATEVMAGREGGVVEACGWWWRRGVWRWREEGRRGADVQNVRQVKGRCDLRQRELRRAGLAAPLPVGLV